MSETEPNNRPYGTVVADNEDERAGIRRRLFLFSPVGVQVVLVGTLIGHDVGLLPSLTDDYLMGYGWIASLVSLVALVAAFVFRRPRRKNYDILIAGLNCTVGVIGLLFWGFMAVALAAVGV